MRRVSVLLLLVGVLAFVGTAQAGGHGRKKPVKTAILLVTFGTSVPKAQKVFAGIEAAYKKAFPGVTLRWAYTSRIIRKKVRSQGKVWLSPAQALAKLMAQDYTQVAVQSLHVIPGAEYHDLVRVVRGFRRMSADFKPLIGYPLCATTDDLKAVAAALLANLPRGRKNDEAVLFMGHGSHHPAAMAYPALAYQLRLSDPLVLVGTVEGYPALGDLLPQLKAMRVKKAYLLPFMTVAGDHAINDMAGPQRDSWKSRLKQAGIGAVPILKAISQNPRMVAIWIEHTKRVLWHFR